MTEPHRLQARPRAIFLTPVLPSRSGMGLAMRAGSQLAGLMQVFNVTTLLIPLVESGRNAGSFAAEFPGTDLECIACGGLEDPYFRLIASMSDPDERLYHFERYGKPSLAAALSGRVSDHVAERVVSHGAAFIHVFRSYLLDALDHVSHNVTRSLDLDEDDASSFLSTAAVLADAGRGAEARWANLEARAFDSLISRKLRGFRAVTLANAEDVPRLRARLLRLSLQSPPLQSLPNCVRLPPPAAIARGKGVAGNEILFVGSLRYEPNVEGLLWFLTSVLPRLPAACLLVAGRSPPRQLLSHARAGRVKFLGYVDDLSDAYRQAALAIAPMRSGGGTRLKILEAGAHGVPVVATPEAAAGLGTQARFWGRTASSARHFAAACQRLLDNPQEARRLGMLGRHSVAARFSSVRIEEQWADMFRGLQEGDHG